MSAYPVFGIRLWKNLLNALYMLLWACSLTVKLTRIIDNARYVNTSLNSYSCLIIQLKVGTCINYLLMLLFQVGFDIKSFPVSCSS